MNDTNNQQESNTDFDESQIQLRIQVASQIYPELIKLALERARADNVIIARWDVADEALMWADMLIKLGRRPPT